MGCLCVPDILEYDPAYFAKLVGFAQQCDDCKAFYTPMTPLRHPHDTPLLQCHLMK